MLWRPKRELFGKRRARDWKSSPRVGIAAAIGVLETRTGPARVGARQEKVRQPADALRVDGDVRAQKEHKAALAALKADVGGAAVTKVLRLHEHGRLRELIGHRRG